mmetsp:Transcript_65757/g.181592  ORF Transcript_65757/g.181592 Transcript_65757/m.181592 type:complete len:240 (-) Transcript_65757:271-990(-)
MRSVRIALAGVAPTADVALTSRGRSGSDFTRRGCVGAAAANGFPTRSSPVAPSPTSRRARRLTSDPRMVATALLPLPGSASQPRISPLPPVPFVGPVASGAAASPSTPPVLARPLETCECPPVPATCGARTKPESADDSALGAESRGLRSRDGVPVVESRPLAAATPSAGVGRRTLVLKVGPQLSPAADELGRGRGGTLTDRRKLWSPIAPSRKSPDAGSCGCLSGCGDPARADAQVFC